MTQKPTEHNPGAGLMERFRNQHVAVRWGVVVLVVFVLWILLTAI